MPVGRWSSGRDSHSLAIKLSFMVASWRETQREVLRLVTALCSWKDSPSVLRNQRIMLIVWDQFSGVWSTTTQTPWSWMGGIFWCLNTLQQQCPDHFWKSVLLGRRFLGWNRDLNISGWKKSYFFFVCFAPLIKRGVHKVSLVRLTKGSLVSSFFKNHPHLLLKYIPKD